MEKLGIVYLEMNVLDLCCHSDHHTCAFCCIFITDETECMIRQVVHVLEKQQSGRNLEKEAEQNVTAYLRPEVLCV